MSTLSGSVGLPLTTVSGSTARMTAVRDQLRREVEELEAQLAAAPPAAEEADEEAGPPQGQAAMPGLEALVGAKSSDRQRRALTEKACATGAGLFGATPSSVRVRPRGDGLVEYSFDTVVSPSASPRGPVPRGASAWALAFKLQVRPAAPPGAVPRIETMALQCPGAAMWPELAAALDRAQVRRAGRHCPGAVDRRPHPGPMQRLRDPGLATSTLRSYAAQHAERARVFLRLESRFSATLAAHALRGAAHSATLVARCGGGRGGSEAISLVLHWTVAVDDLGRATSTVSLHPRAAMADPPEAIVSLSDRFKRVVGVVGVEKGAEAVLELLESAAVRRGVTMSRDEVGADYGAGGTRGAAEWGEEEEEEGTGLGRTQKRLRKR